MAIGDRYNPMHSKMGKFMENIISRNTTFLGVILITSAVCLLSLSDALVKLHNDRFSIAQLIFLRSALACVFLLVIWRFKKRGTKSLLRPTRWVIVRSLLLCAMWLLYYCGLPDLSFAVAAAALYTAPLFMAVFARLILGTPIDLPDQAALGAGLIGVVMAVQPSPENLSPSLLLPFGAAACYAMAAVLTRAHCRNETSLGMAINLNLCLAVGGGIALMGLEWINPMTEVTTPSFLMDGWRTLSLMDFSIICLLAAFMTYIAIAVAQAYKTSTSITVGLFDNAYLFFAVVWSIMFFDDLPNIMSLAGITLLAGAAVMSALPRRNVRLKTL